MVRSLKVEELDAASSAAHGGSGGLKWSLTNVYGSLDYINVSRNPPSSL